MRIVKKIIKGKEFLYLQHSYRGKNGKVRTDEAYLGKEMPDNIEEIKERFEEKIRKNIHAKLESIKNNFQKEWSRLPASIKEKEKEQIAIAFTYNTNAIEGSTITLADAREIIERGISPNKPLDDVKETDLHAKVFLEMLDKKEKLSVDLLLKWHGDIFSSTKKDVAGKFRDYMVRIGEYRAVDWQDIGKLMADLVKFVEKTKMNPVEIAGIAHYRFEKIHPFGDGNGRIGRLLMNFILWHNHYPMLIIENRKRRAYYRAFTKDEKGFYSYFLRTYLRVHKSRLGDYKNGKM